MQEPTLLLLAALAAEPKHGYALIQEVDTISAGRVRLRVGTLYSALDRLQREGLIRVEREEVVDGRARKVYALADQGHDALAAETRRLRALLAAVEQSARPRERASKAVSPRPRGALA